jgi:molybdate-binding protein
MNRAVHRLDKDVSSPITGVNVQRSARADPMRFIRCPNRELGLPTAMVGDDLESVVDVVAAVLGAGLCCVDRWRGSGRLG